MSDVSITAANVLASGGASRLTGVFGGTVTAGEPCSLNSQNQYVACANGSTAVLAKAVGIALVGGALGQPALLASFDANFTPGFTSTIGATVWTSANAGGITVTAADNATTGQFVGVLGVMNTTTTMTLNISISTGAHA